jgi:hypothetical protein
MVWYLYLIGMDGLFGTRRSIGLHALKRRAYDRWGVPVTVGAIVEKRIAVEKRAPQWIESVSVVGGVYTDGWIAAYENPVRRVILEQYTIERERRDQG